MAHTTKSAIVMGIWLVLVTAAFSQAPQGPRPAPGWPRVVGNAIYGGAAVTDLDGDGCDEVAVGLRDGRVFLLGPKGRTLPGWPRSTTAPIYLSTVFVDLDGDRLAEVVAASLNGAVHAWRRDGSDLPGWPVDLGAAVTATPLPLTVDGATTLVVPTQDGRVHQLDAGGSPVPGWPVAASERHTTTQDLHPLDAADLDGDGKPEILLLTAGGQRLHAWTDDGRPVAGYPRVLDAPGVGLAVAALDGRVHLACTSQRSLQMLDAHGLPLWSHGLADPDDAFSSPPRFIAGPGGQTLLVGATRLGWLHIVDRQGTSLPGWPQRLGGFIYGLAGDTERFAIDGAPISHDIDGDGEPELLVGSYDQHLYALEFDGEPVPGWPLTLGDSCRAAPVLAQLDGHGEHELVVTQSGETVFAFQLHPASGAAITAARPDTRMRGGLVVVLMVVLLVALIIESLRGSPWRSPGVVVTLGAVALASVLVTTAVRHEHQTRRLAAARSQVEAALSAERDRVQRRTARLTAALDSTFAAEALSSGRLLYHLERLADLQRLNHEAAGLVVLGPDGRPRQAVGLLRRYALSPEVLAGGAIPAGPLVLGDNPVEIEARPLSGALAGHRLVHAASILDEFPHRLARATGASVHLRLGDRTLAWAGAPPAGAVRAWPWLGVPRPTSDLTAGASALTVRLTDESEAWPALGWLALALIILLPVAAVRHRARHDPGWIPRGSRYRLVALGVCYAGGWLLLSGGGIMQRPVSLGGHVLELALHLAGWTGVVLGLRALVGGHRGRRLSFALASSYLLVSLLPLTLAVVIAGALLQQAQRAMASRVVAGLERHADHLALAYVATRDFQSGLVRMAAKQLDRPPESDYYNFVGETQFLFTYDMPTAYLTLDVHDRADPTRRFTGFSWRVPRTEKFPAPRLQWALDADPHGLFLDGSRAVVRASRIYRTQELEALITSHLPLDAAVLNDLADELRILPLLPRVLIEPAWLAPVEPVDRDPGWRLPLATRIALPARDWHTGDARWVVYDAWAFLPAGRELFLVLSSAIVLTLLPLGLSAWGALGTWRRTGLPLNRLLDGIRRVAAGDLDVRLGGRGTSEIAATSRAFDEMTGSLRDTIRVEAEHQKAEEVSALKSHFLSMVSHDLKTPLASIQGAAENLLADLAGPLNDRQRQYIEMVLASSGNLQQMVADILDLTRIESGQLRMEMEDIELAREIEHLVQSLRPLLEERDLRAEVSVTSTRPRVRADRTRLWQVLSNVLGNAVRHSPQGGVIRIAVADAPEGAVRITVADDGPGIPAAEREKIFEAYYARARGGAGSPGAGLGLAIVKQLVELQGGTVALAAAGGGGARLMVTLAAAPDPRAECADLAHPAPDSDSSEPPDH